MQKREGRSFAAPPSIPARPDLGRTGRKGLPPQAPLPPLTSALSRRAALFGAVTVAGCTAAAAVPAVVQAAAVPSRTPTASVAPSISTEAAALQAELAQLSSTYRRACREADDTLAATADVEPPEALYSQPEDGRVLWPRFPVKSWASPDRHWYGDDDLIERLRGDSFRTLAGTPTAGAARRDEILTAWDGWKAAERAAEDASGHTAAQERYEAALNAYQTFRTRLVEMRTDDPEVLTVKALAIVDLIRGDSRGLGRCIERALERDSGPYEDALSLSLVSDFLGLMGADHRGGQAHG